MDKELFDRVLKYRSAMTAIRTMFLQGLINEGEYAEIDRKIASKYGLDLSTIYR